MPATISDAYARAGKLGDEIAIIGTGFEDAPNLTKVYKRAHGETAWEVVTVANLDFVSATELTLTLAAGDSWDGGMNDIGVSTSAGSSPDDSLDQALQFYTPGSDDADNVVVGPPDGVYVEGRYCGDFADAVKLNISEEIKRIYTQHSRYPVKTYPGDSTGGLDVPLAEFTPENVKLTFGSAAAVQDLGSERKRLTFGGRQAIVYKDVLLILPGPTGFKVALGIYRCGLSASGEITWGKDDNARLPVKLEILADTARAADDQLGYFEWIPIA